MFILISYDIVNDKRRTKIGKLLEDHGGRRVQRSVFECHLTAAQYTALQTKLRKLLADAEDSVRCYTLCANCQPQIVYLGIAAPTEQPGLRII